MAADSSKTVSLNLDGSFAAEASRAASASDKLARSLGDVDKAAAIGGSRRKTIGERAVANRSPWAGGRPPGPAPRAAAAPPRPVAVAKPGGDDDGGAPGLGKSLKYVAKQAGISKAALGALGVAATLELSKFAMGIRGMAMLQALGMRAAIQFRSLFRGVDPTPVTRAFDRLTQLVNPATATGKAMSRAFSEAFNGLFGLVERAEPYLSGFFKQMIIGGQDMQIAWLRLRIATLPMVTALGELADEASSLLGPLGALPGAAGSTADDFREITDMARSAAAGLREFNSAAAAFNKGTFAINAKENLGMISHDEAARQRVEAGAAAHSRPADDNGFAEAMARKEARAAAAAKGAAPGGDQAAAARAAGNATGQAYAAGMAEGADAGGGAVDAAGQRLAGALDKGVRTKGQIHSPSKLARETAREYPRGAVQGIEEGAADVQAAGGALVPNMPGAGQAGAGARGATGGVIQVSIKHEWGSGRPSDARAYERAAEAGDMRALRSFAQQLGVSVELAA